MHQTQLENLILHYNWFIALDANTTGDSNTAIGRVSLSSNTTGEYNTAVGNECINMQTQLEVIIQLLEMVALTANTTGQQTLLLVLLLWVQTQLQVTTLLSVLLL